MNSCLQLLNYLYVMRIFSHTIIHEALDQCTKKTKSSTSCAEYQTLQLNTANSLCEFLAPDVLYIPVGFQVLPILPS